MPNHNKNRQSILLFLLVFLFTTHALISADQLVATGLEARGRIEGSAFNPVTGKTNQSVAYLFVVDVLDAKWRIRIEDERVRLGLVESSEWSELIYDGRDIFSLTHISEELRKKFSKSGGVEYPNDFGTAKSSDGFPLEAGEIERFLWLAFCSPPYLRSLTGGVMPSTTSPLAAGINTRAEFTWTDPAQQFVKSFREYWPGVRVHLAPPTLEIVKCPKPYDIEYLVGKYDVATITNWNGMVVPTRFTEYVHQIFGADAQATNVLVRVQQGWITELVTAPQEFWKAPRTAGSSIIKEQRFADKDGTAATLSYSEDKPTDTAWLDRKSATFDQDVAAKRKVLPIVSARKATSNPWRQWVISGSLLGILIWYIFGVAKRKATPVTNTKQH